MKKFIHSGMPKTMTSALQTALYPSHKDIYYLGVGNGETLIDYVDDDMEYLFETLMLYSKNEYYDLNKKKASDAFNKHIKKAYSMEKKVFGISSEWISVNLFPTMIDNQLKIKRLASIFGNDTIIIVFTRSQDTFIKSIYGQMVQEGLPFTYSDFINYLNDFKDRNFYYDLFYDLQYQNYLKYFKKENIYFLPIENYRDKNKKLIVNDGKISIVDNLCKILDIGYPENFELPHINPTLSDEELYHKVELNKKYRHDFGNLLFENTYMHRNRAYFKKEGNTKNQDYFKDIKIKRFALEQAKLMAKSLDQKVAYTADKNIIERMNKEFIESNSNLKHEFGIDLPDCYFDI